MRLFLGGRSTAVRISIFAFTVVALVGTSVGPAEAASPAKLWRKVGLVAPYSYKGDESKCAHRTPADPINIVWYGPNATPGQVGKYLFDHGWKHNDYQSPLGVDEQHVRELDQCYRDDTERATHNPLIDRDHTRLFSTARSSNIYVVGDAHHDHDRSAFTGCHTGVFAGHIASSFNSTRNKISNLWPAAKKHKYWGNTRRMKQCDGSFTASDGWVTYMATDFAMGSSGSNYHPTSTTAPAIVGSPVAGTALSVNPGIWSGSPQPGAFIYRWCYADLDAGDCTAIPGADSEIWVPSALDIGKRVAVKVRPDGSSPIDAVISVAVVITAPVGGPPVSTTGGFQFGPSPEDSSYDSWVVDGVVDPGNTSTTYVFKYQSGGFGNVYSTTAHVIAGGAGAQSVEGDVSGCPSSGFRLFTYWLEATNQNGTSVGSTESGFDDCTLD